MQAECLLDNLLLKVHLRYRGENGKMPLRCILEKAHFEYGKSLKLAQDRVQLSLVALNLRVLLPQ